MNLWRSQGVSRSIEGKLGSVTARTEPGRPGSRSLSVGLFFPRLRCSSPVQYAMANMADITNSCSSPLAPSGPTPSITQTAIPTQLRTRARSRDPWGTGEGGGEGGGPTVGARCWMLMKGCKLPRLGLFSSYNTPDWWWRAKTYLFFMWEGKKKNLWQ